MHEKLSTQIGFFSKAQTNWRVEEMTPRDRSRDLLSRRSFGSSSAVRDSSQAILPASIGFPFM